MVVWRVVLGAFVATGAVVLVPVETEAGLTCDGKPVTVNLASGDSPTNGPDVIRGTPGRDVINAKRGNDTICAQGGGHTSSAGSGNDTIIAGDGLDAMFGSTGNDQCLGGAGNDAGRCETLTSARRCSTGYPTICVPPPAPDLDCPEIPYRDFRVTSDPHGFDTNDADNLGCETA